MRSLLGLCALFLTLPSFALTITSQIHDLDITKSYDHNLVLLMSGDVVKIPRGDQALTNLLEKAKDDKAWIEFNLDEDREILSVQSAAERIKDDSHLNSPEVLVYEPSVLNTYQEAQKIFKGLNPYYRNGSECYNRAHVWSYESLTKHGLNSMKVFMFYTRKYIREYNFKWWFHVAPFTYVMENGSPSEKVLDYFFANNPLDTKKWTDIFMYNKAECPVITKYTDYSQHEYENWCYLFKTSMYYYQPLDLEALENQGREKNNWVNWEVNNAYRQGF